MRRLGILCVTVLAMAGFEWVVAQDPAVIAQRAADESWTPLFDGKSLHGWEVPNRYEFEAHGRVEVQDGCLIIAAGQPATGVRWTGPFPTTGYEIELEGKRVAGNDFFCGLSFPVGDGGLTLILGGWGGWVVGLSCIDGYYAVDNETCTSREFQNDRWYRIRLRVTPERVSAYLDDEYLCGIDPRNRRLAVSSQMEVCRPLGVATWNTTGALRNFRYRLLAPEDGSVTFQSAKPVWPVGRDTELNLTVGYRAVFSGRPSARTTLKIAASTVYRAWLNGQFVAVGPARGPHGFYRVDALDVTPHVRVGPNVLAVEVAGYNVNSYDTLDQPSFLQAEVVADGDEVLVATGPDGADFLATIPGTRVQKVQRYSFQRPFIEVYRLAPGCDAWRETTAPLLSTVESAEVPAKRLLPRRVLLPQFELRTPRQVIAAGRMVKHEQVAQPWKDRSLVNIGPQFKGYPEDQLETVPSLEMQTLSSQPAEFAAAAYDPADSLPLTSGEYRILDLGTNLTGFLGGSVTCRENARLWFVFDEILTAGDVDFKRLGCVNIISYEMEPGTYAIESIEPYTLRYLKLICVDGACTLRDLHLREYKHPQPERATFECSDPQLNELFRAGIETFRQNVVDLFMDCPSRERAGWLCDSYFTARVARDVTGTTLVERNFFENFLLPQRFEHLPPGMLPMCYPADHNDGVFIPNWSLWFVVQLEEYLQRSGDQQTVGALRDKVEKLLEFFAGYENSDGLLEKLPSWVFVEWSKANEFVQDVNYPSNMLYAGALAAAGRMYGRPELNVKADQVREAVRRQSFDGQFFVDNAVRTDGNLVVTKNRSEVCQYFAFFFDVATPDTHGRLWQVLRDEFGPNRKETRAYWDVHVANSFIGNMLRFELLSRFDNQQQILDESTAYLSYMAERTGTLWENDGAYASCNHGFASHIVHTLYRDVLGIAQVDVQQHTVQLRLPALRLDWCRGSLPTPDGLVQLRWERRGDQLSYSVQTPNGYRVDVDNGSGRAPGAQQSCDSRSVRCASSCWTDIP